MTLIMDPHNLSFKKELLLKLEDGPHPVLQISHQIKNTQGMFSPFSVDLLDREFNKK